MSLPPLLPSIEDELEKYLTDPSSLPIHEIERATKIWERVPDIKRELKVEHGPLSTTIQVERDLNTGQILGFNEIDISEIAGANAMNSTSMRRAPGPPTESTRGNAMNFMFWPGGFDQKLSNLGDEIDDSAILEELDRPEEYLTCPPTFQEGLDLRNSEKSIFGSKKSEVMNLADILASTTIKENDDVLTSIWNQKEEAAEKIQETEEVQEKSTSEIMDEEFGEDIEIPTKTSTEKSTELWAEIIDISQPMLDFHQKVPNMAYTWPFELDTFQKQAVWHLENNDSVFVAAHTSAGKTVVAEYAIALSKKHMTRTIYTSPIKALSNQKFRDFKDTFEDVGLVTGDIQINPSGTCLIMTTEILRSMLYNGSDIIRDLEWVIFDEV